MPANRSPSPAASLPAGHTTASSMPPRLYDGDGDRLMVSSAFTDRVTLLPESPIAQDKHGRIRIQWGQQMLPDLLAYRYRAVICGVNTEDNSHGIIAQLAGLMDTSQWTASSVTSYAKMFSESVNIHAAEDREPYVLKFDLDNLLILAILRPKGRDWFTLDDLARGFSTVSKMLAGRRERLPVASVSFLGARSNKLYEDVNAKRAPSFETVLRTMYQSGFRGDVYPAPQMWNIGHIGVFPSYPLPAGLATMREGGH